MLRGLANFAPSPPVFPLARVGKFDVYLETLLAQRNPI